MAERDPSAGQAFPTELFTGGRLFDTVFARGMALVEETAAYLDGPGRDHAAALTGETSRIHTAWSMELTTRLMQAASWLVMQKAVRDGDMPAQDAGARKYRISREDPGLDPAAGYMLGFPPRFIELVARSEALFEQVCRLDSILYAGGEPAAVRNSVTDQLTALRNAAESGFFGLDHQPVPEKKGS